MRAGTTHVAPRDLLRGNAIIHLSEQPRLLKRFGPTGSAPRAPLAVTHARVAHLLLRQTFFVAPNCEV